MYFFKILLLPTLSCTLFMGDRNSFAFQLQFRLSCQVLEVQGHCCIMFWGKKTGPFSEVLFKEWLVVVVLLIPSLLCLSEHSLFSQLWAGLCSEGHRPRECPAKAVPCQLWSFSLQRNPPIWEILGKTHHQASSYTATSGQFFGLGPVGR